MLSTSWSQSAPAVVDNRQQLARLAGTSRREAADLATARKELLTDEIRLSELAMIGEAAHPLFLDLVGEALSQRGRLDQLVRAVSSDGALRIEMRPSRDVKQTFRAKTSYGTFSGPDFWVSIHDK